MAVQTSSVSGCDTRPALRRRRLVAGVSNDIVLANIDSIRETADVGFGDAPSFSLTLTVIWPLESFVLFSRWSLESTSFFLNEAQCILGDNNDLSSIGTLTRWANGSRARGHSPSPWRSPADDFRLRVDNFRWPHASCLFVLWCSLWQMNDTHIH